jgi:hypothetical protein
MPPPFSISWATDTAGWLTTTINGRNYMTPHIIKYAATYAVWAWVAVLTALLL